MRLEGQYCKILVYLFYFIFHIPSALNFKIIFNFQFIINKIQMRNQRLFQVLNKDILIKDKENT